MSTIYFRKRMRLLLLPVALLFVLSYTAAFSQSKNRIGIIASTEKTGGHEETIGPGGTKTTLKELNPVVGVVYERTFGKHSGIEMALKYRTSSSHIRFPIATSANGSSIVDYTVHEHFLGLPVLYKFHTSVLTVSVGLSLDYFYSAKGENIGSVFITSFEPFVDHKFSVGGVASISKAVLLGKKLVLEPALYYNPVFAFKQNYYGLLLAAKYCW